MGVLGHPLLGAVLDPVAAPTDYIRPLLGTVLDPVAAPTDHIRPAHRPRFWRSQALDTYGQRIGPPQPARIIASLFIHLCISRHTISSVLEEFIYLRYTR